MRTLYYYSENGICGNQIARGNCQPYGSLWKIKVKVDKYDDYFYNEIDVEVLSANCNWEDLTDRRKTLHNEYMELCQDGRFRS
jgi:hypothetical protein